MEKDTSPIKITYVRLVPPMNATTIYHEIRKESASIL